MRSATCVGIIGDEHVTRTHTFRWVTFSNSIDHKIHTAVKNRNTFRLRDQTAFGVEQYATVIMNLTDNRGLRSTIPRDRHFMYNGHQPGTDYFKRNRIDPLLIRSNQVT